MDTQGKDRPIKPEKADNLFFGLRSQKGLNGFFDVFSD